jgi:flavodoxin
VKTLVVYYSRSGRTRKVAEELAHLLDADLDELHETCSRSGLFGYLAGGRDAWLARDTGLAPLKYDPTGHDLVVLAGPVWAFTVCPALRAYGKLWGARLRNTAYLATQGGRGADRAFAVLRELTGRPPAATLTLIDRDIDKERHIPELEAFGEQLRALDAAAGNNTSP